MLQEFATTPDIDGNMLLDNTIVVYVTEVAVAWDHNQQNMPIIVFGGKNTGVQGGTFLKATGGSLPRQTGGTGNRPYNDLWLTVAAQFGVNWKSLGDQTQFSDPSQAFSPNRSSGDLPDPRKSQCVKIEDRSNDK